MGFDRLVDFDPRLLDVARETLVAWVRESEILEDGLALAIGQQAREHRSTARDGLSKMVALLEQIAQQIRDNDISYNVYADNGELIDEFFLEDRKVIKYEDIPKIVIQAFVAAEDARFVVVEGERVVSAVRIGEDDAGGGNGHGDGHSETNGG